MPEPEPIRRLLQHLAGSLQDGSFVRLALASPSSTGPHTPLRVMIRLVELADRRALSLTFRHPTQDITKNLELAEASDWVRAAVSRDFGSALLATTRRDWQFSRSPSGTCRLVAHKPSATAAPSRAHDRAKATLLGPEAADWLSALGILDSAGKVRASMADKHRQIGRYCEILQSLVREVRWPGEGPPGFVDMGCGKGYLTFGAWHLLHRHLHLPARVFGIEQRPDLVDFGNAVARQVKAEGLEFRGGAIAEVPLPRLDALIALHACDTATDDAILRGVQAGARLIVVAPCCHQQLRPQLSPPPLLAPILRHGLMAERLADWLTDGLRALHLQAAGYRTKVIEFVASGHTPKNLMIAAVRDPAAAPSAEIRSRVVALKSEYGIQHHALDALLTP